MKNTFLKIFMVLLLFFPFMVKADNINSASISGTKSTKTGEDFTLTFKLNFKDIFKNKSDSKGIYAVAFEIGYKDSDFTITGITTDSIWNSAVLKTTDGKYYVISELSGNTNTNMCYDGILFCGTYEARITFSTIKTTAGKSTIQVGEYEAIVLDMITDSTKEISADDLKTISANGLEQTKYTIDISSNTSETVTTKKSIVENSNSSISNIQNKVKTEVKKEVKNKQTTKTTTSNNSNNATGENNKLNSHLKSLKIENYEIDFDKSKNIYTIEVEENINKLNVTAVAESKTAKVKITGADNLEANNNKVTIEVTPEKGDKKVYIINVNKIKEKKVKKAESFKITDEQKDLLIYFLIGVGVVAVLAFIIIKIRDRIVEKDIDKF